MANRVDWNVSRARVEVIADTLGLNYSEVDEALATEEALIEFAERHNQSLDWILIGDVRNLIRFAKAAHQLG